MLKTTGSSVILTSRIDGNEVVDISGAEAENGRSSNKKYPNSLSILKSTTMLLN